MKCRFVQSATRFISFYGRDCRMAVTKKNIQNGCYVNGTGTAWEVMEDFPEIYGIKAAYMSIDRNLKQVVGSAIIITINRNYTIDVAQA